MNKKNYQKIMEDLIRENCTAGEPNTEAWRLQASFCTAVVHRVVLIVLHVLQNISM